MPTLKVTFQECIQDSQEYGSTDYHTVSRVWVDIAVDGKSQGVFIADLKQSVVIGFATMDGGNIRRGTDPIEVSRPIEVGTQKLYRGPFDQNLFAEETAKYFREGAAATTYGCKGTRFVRPKVIEFDATGRAEAR